MTVHPKNYNSESPSTENNTNWKGMAFGGAVLAATGLFTGVLLRRGMSTQATQVASREITRVVRPTHKVRDVKEQHSSQLKKFREWANTDKWHHFDTNHYDWWAFPINRSSRGHGTRFALSDSEIAALKQDSRFMEDYREGVTLVAQSWGWNIQKSEAIFHKYGAQRWTGHGVRLGKMADSLKLFEEKELLQSLQVFSKQQPVQKSLQPWAKRILD